ncbi:MAG: 30S ribosomal protein S1 [Bacillota bacterium]
MHQAKERGLVLDASVVALDFPDNIPTWVLAFDGLDGVKGLVPASETGLPDKDLMPRFVGQQIRVKVKGVDRANGLAACSRREAVAEAAAKLLPALAENPEQVLDAVVRCVVPGNPPRLLVDVGGGVLAEAPNAQARVWLSKPLGAQYAPGQRVKVKVTRVDPQTGVVEASIRKARPDPWETADFRRGQFLACTVVSVRNGIVFLEPDAAPGVLGIAPLPLVGEVSRGDRVTAAVASFDRANRKLRLRLRGRLA